MMHASKVYYLPKKIIFITGSAKMRDKNQIEESNWKQNPFRSV